jgi:hypothetical protein
MKFMKKFVMMRIMMIGNMVLNLFMNFEKIVINKIDYYNNFLMPSERVSKEFKDISLSFQVNPLNYDLIAIKNETAIARSIRNLVLLNPEKDFLIKIWVQSK